MHDMLKMNISTMKIRKPRHDGHGVRSFALHFRNVVLKSDRPSCKDLLGVLHTVQLRPLAKHGVGLPQLQTNPDLRIPNRGVEQNAFFAQLHNR